MKSLSRTGEKARNTRSERATPYPNFGFLNRPASSMRDTYFFAGASAFLMQNAGFFTASTFRGFNCISRLNASIASGYCPVKRDRGHPYAAPKADRYIMG